MEAMARATVPPKRRNIDYYDEVRPTAGIAVRT
jgi:hypothetical protein